jgi:hypothetical protein
MISALAWHQKFSITRSLQLSSAPLHKKKRSARITTKQDRELLDETHGMDRTDIIAFCLFFGFSIFFGFFHLFLVVSSFLVVSIFKSFFFRDTHWISYIEIVSFNHNEFALHQFSCCVVVSLNAPRGTMLLVRLNETCGLGRLLEASTGVCVCES